MIITDIPISYTDENSTNTEIEALIRDNGFEPVRMGGLDQSIPIEVFVGLHEFGPLDKPLREVKQKKLLNSFLVQNYFILSA